jgi:hypothetical protein
MARALMAGGVGLVAGTGLGIGLGALIFNSPWGGAGGSLSIGG